jgi:ribulose-5-phosphate 4-epimerase/fuculose-1-phosphate aldolase
MAAVVQQYQVNQLTPDPAVAFDRKIGEQYIRYAHMLAARGYIQSSVGNMVIRAPHPAYPDGVCYVKCNGVSLEEMSIDDLVVTDVPCGRILYGDRGTTVGHQMNREMLRLRPDIHCVIHLHHDETVALLSAGVEELRPTGLTFSYLMQKPPHFLPAHINVEEDVAPIKGFIQDTNCVLMKRHGFTVLGRTVSECYHRVNTLAAEVKRIILAEQLAAIRGTKPDYISKEEMEAMFRHGDEVMYPKVKQ